MTTNNTTNWNITTDIYDIVDALNNIKKNYLDDEDETTLALGTFGYITDVEAKKIQTAAIMAGQLGNEMFPTKANLTKNVLTHAIYCNIDNINAIPAKMVLNIGMKVVDFEANRTDNKFIFDCETPIFIGDYEFHFDYDIIITRSETSSKTYVYSAHYDMVEENRLSNVTDPYLKQPFIIKIGNYDYIIFQTLVRQVTIEKTIDKIISSSIIENKTYTFEFDNQIVDFDVYVTTDGVRTRLVPVPQGTSVDKITGDYCWYLFISDNNIRITFDAKSYIPGLNSDIEIKAYTTLGEAGEFNYKKIDESSDGFYCEFSSDKYNYDKINCFVVATTDSVDGSDRKSKEELQKLIPKAALSRGTISTEKDISNYFNLIDSEENRLVMRKKLDNQLARVWYSYFMLKDDMGNIIPTNSINIQVDISKNNRFVTKSEDGRYVLPAGTIIKYDPEKDLGYPIDEAENGGIPEIFSDEYFSNGFYYYKSVFNIILNPDPLYVAFYLTIVNKDSLFSFVNVNEKSELQFVATRCNFQRNLLIDQNIYKLTFTIAQSISADFGMYEEEIVSSVNTEGETESTKIITNNMKCILVLYKDESPYRWAEAKLTNYDKNYYRSSWQVNLETDNGLDEDNDIKLLDLNLINSSDTNYGYFDANTKAILYILGKFESGEHGRFDLDSYAPGLEGYTVTNIYEVNDGLTLYDNFSNMFNNKVMVELNSNEKFDVSAVPSVGLHYMTSEDNADYLLDALNEKKAYIDYCLTLLENSMGIDFKFFNTYGNSRTYITEYDNTKDYIGHVDITLKFKVSVKSSTDLYIKQDLIAAIKDYIEDLNETGDWHAPNMITVLMNKFFERVNYIEFVNFNDLPRGMQHIIIDEENYDRYIPEFINVRNRYDLEGNLEPCIDIEIVN